MTVRGVGIDLVDVSRFAASLERTPRLAERLFTDAEREGRDVTSLAARFAAKEAVAKALGAPGALEWHDALISSDPSGQPRLTVCGTVAARAEALGITSWEISLSHDAGCAIAIVIGQGDS